MSRDPDARPPVRLHECRECHLPIIFARLDTGKAIPLNPKPDRLRGNVACRIVGTALVGFVVSRVRRPGPHDRYLMVPHHATCEERPEAKPKPEPDPALF